MNNYIQLVLVFGIATIATSFANIEVTAIPLVVQDLPQLSQEDQHAAVSKRITSRFIRFHCRQFNLDDRFSSKIFYRYLNLLDYGHDLFLQSDIDKFASKKNKVGQYVEIGCLNELYRIFNLAQQQRCKCFQYVLSRLDMPFNFTVNDFIEVDRSKNPWPKTIQELTRLWDMKIKSDWLNLKLLGNNDEKIKLILTKRYNFALKRLAQTQSEDVFQLIMNAFAREIDPHTNYLSPRSTDQFNSEMSLSLEGIGVILRQDEGDIIIDFMLDGGPAAKSKLLTVGDRIVGVGQTNKVITDVIGRRLDDVIDLIKGPKGSKVYLKVLSDLKGVKLTHIVTLIREPVRLKHRAVRLTIKNIDKKKIGILSIPSFYIGLTNDVKVELEKIIKNHVIALIIDLRGNCGGFLTEAVSLSGLFIPRGPIVQVRNNSGKICQNVDNSIYMQRYKGPLTVLIDHLSASASEIFAAAMQDYGRALIVGESSFGKGTVQEYHSLNRIYDCILHPYWPALGSIQYTIQKIYRINGDSIQCKGVTPDIIVPTGINLSKIGEIFEDNALPWDSIAPASYNVIGNINQYIISTLVANYKKRVTKNPKFKYLEKSIAYFNMYEVNKNIVLFNDMKCKDESKKASAVNLYCINKHLIQQGKTPLKMLDNLSRKYEFFSSFCLDETIRITVDLADLEAPLQYQKSS